MFSRTAHRLKSARAIAPYEAGAGAAGGGAGAGAGAGGEADAADPAGSCLRGVGSLRVLHAAESASTATASGAILMGRTLADPDCAHSQLEPEQRADPQLAEGVTGRRALPDAVQAHVGAGGEPQAAALHEHRRPGVVMDLGARIVRVVESDRPRAHRIEAAARPVLHADAVARRELVADAAGRQVRVPPLVAQRAVALLDLEVRQRLERTRPPRHD